MRMRNPCIIVASLFFLCCIGCALLKNNTYQVKPYTPDSKTLHDTITYMDSLFFDTYNHCRLAVFDSLISEDIEFYHDRGGLTTSKKELLLSLKNNICGKVTRELLPGSIEVHPIPKYGAVQMGAHRFFNNQEKNPPPSLFSKFVHTWHNQNGKWQLTRVISLH